MFVNKFGNEVVKRNMIIIILVSVTKFCHQPMEAQSPLTTYDDLTD